MHQCDFVNLQACSSTAQSSNQGGCAISRLHIDSSGSACTTPQMSNNKNCREQTHRDINTLTTCDWCPTCRSQKQEPGQPNSLLYYEDLRPGADWPGPDLFVIPCRIVRNEWAQTGTAHIAIRYRILQNWWNNCNYGWVATWTGMEF